MIGKSHITGMVLGYFLICPRKAWFSHQGLWMEHESESVLIGRHLDTQSYSRELKQIDLEAELEDGTRLKGRVDWIELREGILHETKLGRSCEEAHKWQLRFYLLLLKLTHAENNPGTGFRGEINYTRLKKKVPVELDRNSQQTLLAKIQELKILLHQADIPEIFPKRSFCRKCAFEELCYT